MSQNTTAVAPFVPPANDPLAAEHAMIQAWTEEALRTFNPAAYQKEPTLDDNPAGQAIAAARPPEARRIVAAAAARLAHWDRLMNDNPDIDHTRLWGQRFLAAIPLNALMRRTLP